MTLLVFLFFYKYNSDPVTHFADVCVKVLPLLHVATGLSVSPSNRMELWMRSILSSYCSSNLTPFPQFHRDHLLFYI